MEWAVKAYAILGVICLVVLIVGAIVFYTILAIQEINRMKRERAAEEKETRKDVTIKDLKEEVSYWRGLAEERRKLIYDIRQNEKNGE